MTDFSKLKYPLYLQIKPVNNKNAKEFLVSGWQKQDNFTFMAGYLKKVKVKGFEKIGNVIWLILDLDKTTWDNMSKAKGFFTERVDVPKFIPTLAIREDAGGLINIGMEGGMQNGSAIMAKFDDVIDVISESTTTNQNPLNNPNEVIDNKTTENKDTTPVITETKKSFFTPKNIFIGLVGIGVVIGILKWKKVF